MYPRNPMQLYSNAEKKHAIETEERIQRQNLLGVLQEKLASDEDLHGLILAEQFEGISALKTETAKISYLHAAAAAGATEEMIFLLHHGFDIETLDEKGRTAVNRA